MKYPTSLAKKEREDIFRLFVENKRLKFNEIEKQIKIRSNMVSYHLEQLLKDGMLEKKEDYYKLTKEAEKYIPVVSHIVGKDSGPLPVVLVALVNKDKVLMIKRKKRPYQNYWSMIGGKISINESIQDAAKRQIKKKSGIDAKFVSTNSVLHERVIGEEIVKHAFILFFVKMKTDKDKFKESKHGKLKWISLSDVDNGKIIPSDLWLIKNKIDSKIDFTSALMNEKEGELTGFEVLK